jgi:uncharacterized protein
MSLPITSLYAAPLALVYVALMGAVGYARSKTTVALGDGGDRGLVEASRRHMNFVENVPLALLLIALVELNGGSSTWVHVLGGVLLVARLVHPFGITNQTATTIPRGAGATGTLFVIAAAAITLLWQHFV